MNYPLQTVSHAPSVPVQFSYSQVSPNISTTYHHLPSNINSHLPSNINSHPNFIPQPTKQVFYEPLSKSTSQIIYRTQTLPSQFPSGSFHHPPNTQPIFHNTSQSVPFQTTSVPIKPVRPHSIGRDFSDFRRDVSPMNTPRNQNSQISYSRKDPQMEKYDSLRWQNKYEDLKTKYFDLLSIVQNNSQVQDTWLIQQQNKLLKQKVKLLQAKDQKYYNEVSTRIEKLVNFHKDTTTQQACLLIDRFRLENKFLSKV